MWLSQVGLVRDLQFITPVKAKIGPPQAMCHQTQRLQVGSAAGGGGGAAAGGRWGSAVCLDFCRCRDGIVQIAVSAQPARHSTAALPCRCLRGSTLCWRPAKS